MLAWGKVDGADTYEVQVAEMVSVGVDGWDGAIEWTRLVEDEGVWGGGGEEKSR